MAFLKNLSPTTKWILAALVLAGVGFLVWGVWGLLAGLIGAVGAAQATAKAREDLAAEHKRIDARTNARVDEIKKETAEDLEEIRARTEERVEDPTEADLERLRGKFGGGGDGDAGKSGG